MRKRKACLENDDSPGVERKLPGEVAIFTSLVIVMVSALLFTAIEASRINAASFYLQMASDAALESCFGEYYLPLWEQYHLLFIHEDEAMSDRAERYLEMYGADSGSIWGTSFMGFGEAEVEPASQYITDYGAEAFYLEAVNFAEHHMVTEVFESFTTQGSLLDSLLDISGLMNGLSDISAEASDEISALEAAGGNVGGVVEDTAMDTADEVIEGTSQTQGLSEALMDRIDNIESELDTVLSELESNGLSVEGGSSGETHVNEETSEMPSYSLRGLLGDAYLSFFVGSTESVSDTQISETAIVSRNTGITEESGNGSYSEENENGSMGSQALGFFLFREYLLDQFSSYVSPSEDHEMSYEIEYLLGGKTSDKSNLIYTINRLMMVRGAVDFVENVANADRRAEALMIATAIGGFLGSEQVIKCLQYAILAVWALNDAASEVRALLSGEKVAFFEWNEQQYLQMGYGGYLRLLLYLKSTEKLKYRGLDLIQATMQQEADFSIERCVYRTEINVTAESGSLFTSVIDMGGGSFWGRRLTASSEYCYGDN